MDPNPLTTGDHRLDARLRLRPDGSSMLVFDAAGTLMHRLEGPAVAAIRAVQDGLGSDAGMDEEVRVALEALIEERIVVAGVPRRSALRQAALVAGTAALGVRALTLPSAAQAASPYTTTSSGWAGFFTSLYEDEPAVAIEQNGVEYWLFPAFTSSGAFSVFSAGDAEILLVAGGASGGVARGGGGGAGGVVLRTVSLAAGDYQVTIGSGGAGANPSQFTSRVGGNAGQDSTLAGPSLATVTAVGGGGGGAGESSGGTPGGDGGSGGGGSGAGSNSGDNIDKALPGAGTSDQGNDGGKNPLNVFWGSGGGGAGALGSAASGSTSSAVGGAGGAGADVSGFLGQPAGTTFLGGGGGGTTWQVSGNTRGAGGTGGGGASSLGAPGESGSIPPEAGLANTGGGGGGVQVSSSFPNQTSGAGGSGILYLRTRKA